MTTRDEMQERVLDAIRRYEEDQARRCLAWSRVRSNGVRLSMRKPKMSRALRVWCADDDAKV